MDKNIFGGANPNGLYVPMTEVEQETLFRLVEAKELVITVHGWTQLPNPPFTIGDKRVSVRFQLDFTQPELPVKVDHFDLELHTVSGISLFRQKLLAYAFDGGPVWVGAGVSMVLDWSISVHHLDPNLVKMVNPHAVGLTSRRIDKDSGMVTATGNMKLNPVQRKLLKLADG